MAKIPLRAYIKEIENQIERGEIEQAIGHAKNILKSYPKNIDTYRLLGKAFLESQRYSEAADILQRVLSVLPDDFISQIGMSIIREDEGNLDASIWHMERAYEVQPFNPAVQEELRRLYGRRDGIEPPKIRLTRGALVRMYSRGELYSQAIAETRAALAEDPQRLDLLVLLARLYYLSDHKNDAAEVCSELLRKLPYCYEANQLLAQFLPTTNRAEEAQKFLQRIYALDPYAAFISPTAPTSNQVPDQAVMVEQFTWESAMEDAQTPEWARNVGVAWEEKADEVLPDWLNTLKPEAPPARSAAPAEQVEDETFIKESAPAEETEGLDEPKDELIPDWMKDAGWIPSDRRADEVMAEQAAAQAEDSDEILPAELPDWVQSIAPPETGQAPELDERTDWLETILSQPEGENGNDSGIVPSPQMEKDESQEGLPDWVTNAGTGTQMPSPTDLPAGDLPDWFSQMEGETQPAETTPAEDLKPTDFEGLPDWSQLGEPAIAEPTPDTDKTPDWLRSFDASNQETPASTEQAPDWLGAFDAETLVKPDENGGVTDWLQSVQPEAVEPAADIPDWLQTLSGEEEGSLLPEAEKPLDEALVSAASEILAEIETPETIEAPALEALEEVQPEPALDASVPQETTIVEELSTAAVTLEPTVEGMPDLSDMDSAMAWLESLAAKQGADEATLVTPPEQRLDQPPDWVTNEMESQEPTALQPEVEIPAPTEELPDLEEMPVAPAETASELPEWLQSIESESELTSPAGEPAPVEETPILAEEGELELPDWMQVDEVTAPEETIETAPAPQATAQPETAMPDLSDMDSAMAWLESLAAKQGADEATLVTPPEQRLEQPPDWVTNEMEAQAPVEPLAGVEAAAEAEAEIEAKIEQPAMVQEPTLPEAVEPVVDWLEQEETVVPAETIESVPAVEEQPAQPQAAEAAMPDFSDMDAAMAWLESLAAKQGADEATLVTPPEQRLDKPPDWVTNEMEAQAPAEPVVTEYPTVEDVPVESAASYAAAASTAEAEEAVLPDWLQDAIAEETPVMDEAAVIAELETPAALEPEPTVPAELPPMETPEVESPVAPDAEMDMDSAFAWLESLAEKQGAQEGTLITTPEERLEAPPDWVQQEQELASEAPAAEIAADAEAEVPEFAQELTEPSQVEEQAAIQESQAVEQQPQELPAIEETAFVFEEPELQEPVEVVFPPVEETVPDWLSSIGQDETTEPTQWPGEAEAVSSQTTSREEIPDWLKEPVLEEPAAAETNAIPLETPAEAEAVPDWLMDLEAGEAEEYTQPYPTEAETPPAQVDFRSAWEPEVEFGQPVTKGPAGQPAAVGSLSDVQLSLNHGDLDQALAGYNSFIQSGTHLDETIHDLRDALYRYPVDISIWQTLGDAYARNNQLQEALDAYTKAEELLR